MVVLSGTVRSGGVWWGAEWSGAEKGSCQDGARCHSISPMARRARPRRKSSSPPDPYGAFSVAVERFRQGEQILTLIDPAARGRDPARFSEWLSARLTISELPRLLLPRCDKRCTELQHDPEAYVVLADISLDQAEPRLASWWADWNDTLERELTAKPIWYAGLPAVPDTEEDRRLRAGTRLARISETDPFWVHYDSVNQERLYRIVDGPHEGASVIAVRFGPSPLLPALAGVLIAPDHPPARDPAVAVRMLAAGWAAVERGLPYEE